MSHDVLIFIVGIAVGIGFVILLTLLLNWDRRMTNQPRRMGYIDLTAFPWHDPWDYLHHEGRDASAKPYDHAVGLSGGGANPPPRLRVVQGNKDSPQTGRGRG